MRTVRIIVLSALLALIFASSAAAAEPTRDNAREVVDRVVTMMRESGVDQTIVKINDGTAGLGRGSLYVFVIGPEDKIVAHGADRKRIGLSAHDLYDVDGEPYGQVMLEFATDDGTWIEYKQYDPESRRVRAKSSWIVRENGYIVGCGVYQD